MKINNTLVNLAMWILLIGLISWACSGCGYTGMLGTIGTTSFLAEANKGQRTQMDYHTDEEREQLAAVIQRGGK